MTARPAAIPLKTDAERVAAELLRNASNRGEAVASVARAVLCALVLARFAAVNADSPGAASQALLDVPVLSITILASVSLFLRARKNGFGLRAPHLFAVLDALVCATSLASTVLWPPGDYQGLFLKPDPAAFIAILLVTVLRLNPSAAVTGMCSNFLLTGGLVLLDVRRNGPQLAYGPSDVALIAIFELCAGAVAYFACSAAHRMVLDAGRKTAELERARTKLGTLLREHHDVRSLLASARLRVDLAKRKVGDGEAGPDLAALSEDLDALHSFVEAVKNRVFSDLVRQEGAAEVDVQAALRAAGGAVAARFPSVAVKMPSTAAKVLMVGGEKGLVHVLVNLLVNACEGDGRRGARSIEVTLDRVPDHLPPRTQIAITDDGPGFPQGVLDGTAASGATSKAEGSGMGLVLVTWIVEASGGTLRARDVPGGARVEVDLLAAA